MTETPNPSTAPANLPRRRYIASLSWPSAMPWRVYDTATGEVVATAASEQVARSLADALEATAEPVPPVPFLLTDTARAVPAVNA